MLNNQLKLNGINAAQDDNSRLTARARARAPVRACGVCLYNRRIVFFIYGRKGGYLNQQLQRRRRQRGKRKRNIKEK